MTKKHNAPSTPSSFALAPSLEAYGHWVCVGCCMFGNKHQKLPGLDAAYPHRSEHIKLGHLDKSSPETRRYLGGAR